MKTLRLLLALVILLPFGKAVASTADAENFLKKSVGEVVDVAKKSNNTETLAAGVRPILLKTISFDAMTRRAVGPGWRQFSEPEKKEAIALFTTLIIRTYSSKFTPGELPDVVYKAATETAPGRVEVSSTTLYKGSRYEVVYRLEQPDGNGWRVTDVVIEGVSMIANYRGQFDAQFVSGGAAAVLGSLKKSATAPAK
ncbi:MAG: MlaC/ttg2D family ABC transporter substrate-binding protein [Terrimicrobiaceae bacterium]